MNIAIIAHDKKKQQMISLCQEYKDVLALHTLYATGTTGLMVTGATGLTINCFKSGPLGGDQHPPALRRPPGLTHRYHRVGQRGKGRRGGRLLGPDGQNDDHRARLHRSLRLPSRL